MKLRARQLNSELKLSSNLNKAKRSYRLMLYFPAGSFLLVTSVTLQCLNKLCPFIHVCYKVSYCFFNNEYIRLYSLKSAKY